MGSDNWFGVEPPRDANGKAIPLDTEILYTKNGQVFQVGEFHYSTRVNRWFTYGHYEHERKSRIDGTSCFLLTPPDSWEKLEEDAMKHSCDYFGIGLGNASCGDCPHGSRRTGRACWANACLDMIARAKKLSGIEEQEGK